MKKTFLLLALLLQVFATLWAQTNQKIVFANPADMNTSAGQFLQSTSDGGFILTGSSTNNNSYGIPRLIKLDANLQVAWDKSYLEQSPPDGMTATPYSPARQTSDGGYALAFRNDSTQNEFLRLDASGDVLWEKDLSPYTFRVNLLGVLPDDGFVLTIRNNNDLLLHLDASGNTISQAPLPSGSISALLSGGDVISAYKNNNKTVFRRTDIAGNLIWQSPEYPGLQWSANQGGAVLVAAPNDGFVFMGYVTALDNNRLYLFDNQGNQVWQSPDNAIPATLKPESVAVTAAGRYVISGKTAVNRGFVAQMNAAGDGIEWSAESPEDGQEHLGTLWAIPTADGWAAGVAETTTEKFGFMKVGVNSGIVINTLSGRVAKDNNNDCAVGNNESGLHHARVFASNGTELFNAFTDYQGHYSIFLPAGDFQVQVAPNQPFFSLCPTLDTDIAFPVGSSNSLTLDLPMQSPDLIHEINGVVHFDVNDNCTNETEDSPLKNWNVHIQTSSGKLFLKTNFEGKYKTFVPDGDYTVELVPLNNHFGVCGVNPQPISLVGPDPQTVTVDFLADPEFYCARMRSNLASSNIRPCSTATIYAQYRNDGTVPAENATITVTLDPLLTYMDASQMPALVDGQSITFNLGTVPATPGDTWYQIGLTVLADCSLGIGDQVCAFTAVTPDEDCTSDPDWNGAIVTVSGECTDENEAVFIIKNIGNAPNSQLLDYVITEDQIVLRQGNFQLNPGEEYRDTVPGNGLPLSMVADQEPGYPGGDTSVVWNIVNCGGSGSGQSSGFGGPSGPFTHQECFSIFNSFDPNDKDATPRGNGPQHFVHPGTPLEYRIRFQNTGNDTAFLVVIRDTLSQHFNFGKLESGGSSHRYEFAQISDSIIQFTFENILLPDSTTNLDGSQGFVDFTIYPKDGLPDGTEVLNRAAIYFDFNEPVITNTVRRVYGKYAFVHTRDLPGDIPVRVYPNPFVSEATFELPESESGEHQLSLFGAKGELLRVINFEGNRFRLLREDLPVGALSWQITNQSRLLSAGLLLAH